jgi:hypothetical protein
MKNLDVVSKRILVISLSISAVLLSASLLIYSVLPANAQTPHFPSRMDDGRRYDAIAFNNTGYVFIWNTQTGAYKSVSYYPNSNSPSTDANGVVNKNLTEKGW